MISVSAVGSLREHLAPGTFLIVDQFIDRTCARTTSFFGTGLVAHVSMAHPVCSRLGTHLENAARAAGIAVARGGTYLVMEGPQFSSLAESELYRSLGLRRDRHDQHARGQTRPRSRAVLRHGGHGHRLRLLASRPRGRDRGAIVRVLLANADKAKTLVKHVVPKIGADAKACDCGCRTALQFALITAPEARNAEMKMKLQAIAGRVL